jgi:urease accessory protein
MNEFRKFCARLAALATTCVAVPASAHHAMDGATPATVVEGLISGLAHPVIGLDHLLFVLAVGAVCYHFGQRLAATGAVLAGALAGTALTLQHPGFAYPDAAVALSLVLLGVLVMAAQPLMKSRAAIAGFALTGIVHGYAYGEAIVGAEPTPLAAYLAGYTLIQLALIGAGYAIARVSARHWPALKTVPALGGGLTAAGVAFVLLALN